jgi:pseudaminic acid biosynthesis-associated methylase
MTKSEMNDQQRFWADEYARDYIRKNSHFEDDLGAAGWAEMLAKVEALDSILECGCNIGRNLRFLNIAQPSASKSIIEISKPAFHFVKSQFDLKHAFHGSIIESKFPHTFDLVFTIGVLIHIHPNDLMENMKRIFEHSHRYVLIGEYFNRTPTMIEYQGKVNRLFKQDFGKMFIGNFPVKLIDYGFLWGHIYDAAGFDDITWWLFEK